jgi:hypothetical protein
MVHFPAGDYPPAQHRPEQKQGKGWMMSKGDDNWMLTQDGP